MSKGIIDRLLELNLPLEQSVKILEQETVKSNRLAFIQFIDTFERTLGRFYGSSEMSKSVIADYHFEMTWQSGLHQGYKFRIYIIYDVGMNEIFIKATKFKPLEELPVEEAAYIPHTLCDQIKSVIIVN
jgi:predicted proteasome-type protease